MKNLSPKEAITILEGMRIDIPLPKAAVTQIKRNLALDMAINALNCSEIPNNSDTISRQAVTKFLNDWLSCLFENCHKQSASDLKMIIKDFKNLPSAQPERKTGRWIESNPQDSKLCRLMTCSECGKAYIVNINVPYEDWTEAHKFCVECGADMRGEENG